MPSKNSSSYPTISTTDIDYIIENYFKSTEDDKKNPYSVYDKIFFVHPKKTNGKKILTTFGRAIINLCFPEDFPWIEFIEEDIKKGKAVKKKIERALEQVLQKYGTQTYQQVLKNLQKYVLLLSTIVSPTFEIDQFELPPHIEEKKRKLQDEIEHLSPVEIDKRLYEIYEELREYLEKKGLTFFDMVKSGTKGKPDDLIQMFIMWGYGVDGEGNLTPPVKHSLLEGISPEERYYGANKAITAAYFKSVGSAKPGHIAIILRNALNDIYIDPNDCKTNKYLELKVTPEIASTIKGRYYLNEKTKNLELITDENAESLIGKTIKLRSPLYCKSEKGVCVICAGKLYEGIEHAGFRATGAYYVRGLNLLMKISHQKVSAGDEVDFESELKKLF